MEVNRGKNNSPSRILDYCKIRSHLNGKQLFAVVKIVEELRRVYGFEERGFCRWRITGPSLGFNREMEG